MNTLDASIFDNNSNYGSDTFINELRTKTTNILRKEFPTSYQKQQKKMRKKLLDYINKGIREGMNADEGLEFFVENEYSQMLYNFLKKQYDGFIHKIMSNVIEVVADYEDSQGAIDAVKKYEIFKAEEK